MTSPRVTSTEVVAAMSTMADGDAPINLRLTASNDAQDKTERTEDCGTDSTMKADGENQIREHVAENGGPDENSVKMEDSTLNNGVDTNIATQSQAPPNSMDEMDQLASNALLAYAQPFGAYGYDLNGFQASQNGMGALPMDQQLYNDSPSYARNVDETRISAYAKLEFEDGEFYMNTYSVILGRDLAAARTAMRRDSEEQKRRLQEEASAVEPQTPVRVKREESRYSKSIVSESGGILREDDSDSDTRRRKGRRASKKSKSTGSSSQHQSRRNSMLNSNGVITYQPQSTARLAQPDSTGAVPVDPASLRPSPHDCPLVGIHPPGATAATGYKAISRQHVKIAYNPKKCYFEAHIIGRNGAFVDDDFYYYNNTVPLKSGSRLQIGGVVVRFVLPDVAIGETGAEEREEYDETDYSQRYSEGGKEMSFDFEEAPRDGIRTDTSEDVSDDTNRLALKQDDDEEDEEEIEDGGEDDEDEDGIEGEQAPVPKPLPQPPKKRGPGRPPKNGIMSKREQKLLEKEAQQKEKDKAAQKSDSQAPATSGKNKVGRPRKHPVVEEEPKREKRKYTKRKPKEPKEAKDPENKEEESGNDDKKDKKDKKRVRQPRSPTPTFNEADLTPEQLAKPQANYVTLIYEAISNSATGRLGLPSIYKAIQRKYPFFVLKCNTNGWQSSVRHNLSQNDAFKKVERDGKGWMWAIVEGVSIEKEKKRKATPPPQLPPGPVQHQAIYTGPPHMMPPGYPPGMMAPPPGYQIQMQPNYPPGHPPPYMVPPQANGQSGPQPPLSGPLHPPFPPQMHPHPNVAAINGPPGPKGSSGHTYNSPYAPKPVASTPPQPQGHHGPPPPPPPSEPRLSEYLPAIVNPQQQQQKPHSQPAFSPLSTEASEIKNAIDVFRENMISRLKGNTTNAEAIVNSAINQVLGIPYHISEPYDKEAEEAVIKALKTMLAKIPGINLKINTPQPSPTAASQPQQQIQSQPTTQPQANNSQSGPTAPPQASSISTSSQPPPKTTGQGKPSPAIMRPAFFTGQGAPNRSSASSIPRPAMGPTNFMKRTNSSGSGHHTLSASPAPSNTPVVSNMTMTNGAGAGAVLSANENGHLAGQKRAYESDGDEMHELKRISAGLLSSVKT